MLLQSRSALRVFILCLAALCIPPEALAANVIIAITGTASGNSVDTSTATTVGLFAPPHTDLKGRSVTLTFTFDDTKGTTTYDGTPPYKSEFDSPQPNATGNVTLQVGGVSYAYPPPAGPNTSIAYVYGGPIQSTKAYFYSNVQDQMNDSNAVALVYGTPLSPYVNWELSFTNSINSTLSGGVVTAHVSARQADGTYLSADIVVDPIISITVSGFTSCSTMPLDAAGPFFKITDPIESVPSSMPGSAICPPNEYTMQQNMIACPLIAWNRANWYDELKYHSNFDVYKEQKSNHQWGAECAYYPGTGMLVPNDVVGHGTADYWPDGIPHLYIDPGGLRLDPLIYYIYWLFIPHPPGVQ